MPGRFVIQSSKRLVVLLSLAHVVALCSIWSTNLAIWGRLGLVLLVLLSLYCQLNRSLSSGKRSWSVFTLDKLRVSVVAQNGEELVGDVSDQTVVTPYFVLLRVKFDGHRLPVSRMIFPDALPGDAYRELCVRLKFA